jgi:hypothetical protein
MRMIAPITHILPLTKIRRARLLPVSGRVVVRVDQKINPTDIIAEARNPGKHVVIDVWRALGFSPNSRSEKWIGRKVGDTVQAGDIIAETGTMFHKVVRAPVECQIIAIGGGQVLLETTGDTLVVQAGISGVVKELVADRGAVVEGDGVLVQGVWGNNRIDMGTLQVIAASPEDELRNDRLDPSMRGAVILAGHCADVEALVAGSDLHIRGMILGSMTADLILTARKVNYPIILVEGFGRIPLNEVVYKTLSTNEKRDVALNAATWNPYQNERPEIFISLPVEGETAPETDEFYSGQIVRIQGSPYAGQIGQILEVYPFPMVVANGSKIMAAEVDLDGQGIIVPLANLDVIE